MLAMLIRKTWAPVSAGLVARRIFENVSELPGNLEYDFIVAGGMVQNTKLNMINSGTQHSR
jgi:hypothetical protein